jgi:DNA-directed RNA polymerase specialized sigma24 family protein
VDELLALGDVELEALLKRLTVHAHYKMRHLTWRGVYVNKGDAVPGGYEACDFAHDAIAKMLDSRRPWNRDKYQTIEAALRATIDSDINHLADSADNARCRRLALEPSKDETAQAYTVPGTEPNPLTTVVDRDWQNRFHKAAMKELKDDPFLIKIFECLEAEITKPEEIAAMLDTTPEEVNNAKKRLRRKLEKLDGKCPPPKRRVKV